MPPMDIFGTICTPLGVGGKMEVDTGVIEFTKLKHQIQETFPFRTEGERKGYPTSCIFTGEIHNPHSGLSEWFANSCGRCVSFTVFWWAPRILQ